MVPWKWARAITTVATTNVCSLVCHVYIHYIIKTICPLVECIITPPSQWRQCETVIGSGWLSGNAFDWKRPVRETRLQWLWPPHQTQLLPMWVVAIQCVGCNRNKIEVSKDLLMPSCPAGLIIMHPSANRISRALTCVVAIFETFKSCLYLHDIFATKGFKIMHIWIWLFHGMPWPFIHITTCSYFFLMRIKPLSGFV